MNAPDRKGSEWLHHLLLFVLFWLWPVTLAARWVGAGETGFVAAFITVLWQLAVAAAVGLLLMDPTITLLAVLFASPFIYARALQTGFFKGLLLCLLIPLISAAFIAVPILVYVRLMQMAG